MPPIRRRASSPQDSPYCPMDIEAPLVDEYAELMIKTQFGVRFIGRTGQPENLTRQSFEEGKPRGRINRYTGSSKHDEIPTSQRVIELSGKFNIPWEQHAVSLPQPAPVCRRQDNRPRFRSATRD